MSSLASRSSSPADPGRWLAAADAARVDKLPRFADGMVAVGRALGETLVSLAATPGEVTFAGLTSCRLEEARDRKGAHAAFALGHAPGWNTQIAVHFDVDVVAVLVQAMFGGSEEDAELSAPGVMSPVERHLAETFCGQLAEALGKGFAAILPSSFTIEPINPRPDLSRLGKPPTAMLVATLVLRIIGPPVDVDILIPEAALEAYAEQLSAPAESEDGHTDPHWSEKLESEVGRARMKLKAHLDLPPMRLGDLARLAVGRTLEFAPGVTAEARLSSGGLELFRCELGQTDGHYSLRIDEEIAERGSSPHKQG